jgi:hypothetical protein
MNPEKKFYKSLRKRLNTYQPRFIVYSGFLGNSNGVVEDPSQPSHVFFRMTNGEVLSIFNNRVPTNIPNLPVFAGYDISAPTLFQVLSVRPVFVPQSQQPSSIQQIAPHNHTWKSSMTTWVRAEQFLPGLPQAHGMSLQIYPFFKENPDGSWTYVGYTEIDMSPYVPSNGAVMALVALDTTGAPVVTMGPVADTIEALSAASIPVSNDYEIAAVRLYAGMSKIRQEEHYTDVFDLRFGRIGSSSGPAGSNGQIQFNNSGMFGADAQLTWNPVSKSLGIGNVSAFPVPFGKMLWIAGEGESTGLFQVTYGAASAPFCAFGVADGSATSPANVKSGQIIGRIRGRGYNGGTWTDTRAEIRFVADGDWSGNSTPTRVEILTTKDSSMTLAATIRSDGNIDIGNGKQYLIGGAPYDGWHPLTVQPVLIGANDPTYTIAFNNVDYTIYLAEGTPIKWTQNNIVRYGFVSSAPIYSNNQTFVTVLTRLDTSDINYDVLNTTSYPITEFKYSLPKQPGLGFPIAEEYWSPSLSVNSNADYASPAANTVYNPGNIFLSVPIGMWQLSASFGVQVNYSGTSNYSINGGLNNVPDAFDNLLRFHFFVSSPVKTVFGYVADTIHLAANENYYVNAMTSASGATLLRIIGATVTTKVKAKCLYL